MSYKSSKQLEWKKSPAYNVMKYRNPETIAKEETLDDFLFWLRYDCEEELPEAAIEDIKALFDKYLEYDKAKVEAGEAELLDQWTKAVGGSGWRLSQTGHVFVNAVHDFEHCQACKA